MKKSTILTFTLILATLVSFGQDMKLTYGFRETYKNDVRTRNIDTVTVSIDESQKRVTIAEQAGNQMSVNCFKIDSCIVDNAHAKVLAVRILDAKLGNSAPQSYLFLDKSGSKSLTYMCGYISYVFDNDCNKQLKSNRLKVSWKRHKDSDHYSFLNLTKQ